MKGQVSASSSARGPLACRVKPLRLQRKTGHCSAMGRKPWVQRQYLRLVQRLAAKATLKCIVLVAFRHCPTWRMRAAAHFMAKASSSPASPPLPDTYELALTELEQLVANIEAGAMPLEALLSAYQRGSQLLGFCKGKLDAIDQQVRLLDGTPVADAGEDA